jgi:hypothetical protein
MRFLPVRPDNLSRRDADCVEEHSVDVYPGGCCESLFVVIWAYTGCHLSRHEWSQYHLPSFLSSLILWPFCHPSDCLLNGRHHVQHMFGWTRQSGKVGETIFCCCHLCNSVAVLGCRIGGRCMRLGSGRTQLESYLLLQWSRTFLSGYCSTRISDDSPSFLASRIHFQILQSWCWLRPSLLARSLALLLLSSKLPLPRSMVNLPAGTSLCGVSCLLNRTSCLTTVALPILIECVNSLLIGIDVIQ